MRARPYHKKRSWLDSRFPVNSAGIFLLSVLLGVAGMDREVKAEAVGYVGIEIDVSGNTEDLSPYWRPSLRSAKAHPSLLPPRQEANKLGQDVNSNLGFYALRLDMDRLPGGQTPGGQSIRPGSKFIDYLKNWQSQGGKVILTLRNLPLGPWDGSQWLYDVLDEECVEACSTNSNPYDYQYPYVWTEDECRKFKCGRSAPDWDAYYALMIDFIKYLTLPPKPGRTVTNEVLFGNTLSYNTQGIDNLYIQLWDEPNQYHYKDNTWQTNDGQWIVGWYDEWPQFLKLYDYFVSAVDYVKALALPDDTLHIKVGGPKFFNGNTTNIDSLPSNYQGGFAMNDAAAFVSFLQGSLDQYNTPWMAKCFDDTVTGDQPYDYKYPGPLPLPLDFMTRQKRTNDHQFLSSDRVEWDFMDFYGSECESALVHRPDLDFYYPHPPDSTSEKWTSNFYKKFEEGDYGGQEPYDQIEWFSWDVRSRANGQVQDTILTSGCDPAGWSAGPFSNCSELFDTTLSCEDTAVARESVTWGHGECVYAGVDMDNHMAAVNYIAQVWDHFENDSQLTIPRSTTDPQPVNIGLTGLWAEFWADPRGQPAHDNNRFTWPDHDADTSSTPEWDYGFYKAGEGMLYTNSKDLNMYEDRAQFPLSVKKPFYNIVEMLGMLDSKQLEVVYNDSEGNRRRDFIRCVATKNTSGSRIAILWWYYRNPDDVHDEFGTWSYDAMMDSIRAHPENYKADLGITLKGLIAACKYDITTYIVDETYSNGWTYRKYLYDYYIKPYTGREPITEVRHQRVLDINSWTKTDTGNGNLYGASVALDTDPTGPPFKISDQQGNISLTYEDVYPWTARLIVMEKGGVCE